MNSHLQLAKVKLFDVLGLALTDFKKAAESEAYGACTFKLNSHCIHYRFAKITPTKTGQFVTLWKRNQFGTTSAFEDSDELDFVVIGIQKDNLVGQFIFPKAVLIAQKIIAAQGFSGKRGFRVYPPWYHALNRQATKTQAWQLRYFVNINAANAPETANKCLTIEQQSLVNKKQVKSLHRSVGN